ncbi:MAG TPA: hypothetical protein EYN67_06330 [Flavobacteriales bacterium]|nr:hypothetical protein [Flavobacteriales bacterium]
MAKSKSEIAIIVQARLASQRVPQKMIRPFAGTTLLDILFHKLADITSLPPSQVFISAFDEPIKEIAAKHNFQVFHRSEESALEERDMRVIFEWHNQLPSQYKYIVMINACNPLLKIDTIDRFIESFATTDELGSFGVVPKKTYYWDQDGAPITDWGDTPTMNTKYVAPVYEAAHCLYASQLDLIGRGYWMCETTPPRLELFPMEELETFDIDEEWQFIVGEKLYEQFVDPGPR